MGVLGGIFGSLFVIVNFRINACRKVCLKSNWSKPMETALWVFMSSSCFFIVPYLLWLRENRCAEFKSGDSHESNYRAWCKGANQYDPVSSLFWSTEGSIIRNIMDTDASNNEGTFNLAVFIGCWYLFTITTYGTNVPAGLFLPGMIIGCGMGKLCY